MFKNCIILILIISNCISIYALHLKDIKLQSDKLTIEDLNEYIFDITSDKRYNIVKKCSENDTTEFFTECVKWELNH